MSKTLTDKVWVKLTELGQSHARGYLREGYSNHQKANGWFEFTLGDLIRNFGSITHQGMGTPFVENEVVFEQPF